ncbi:hypothetical protein CBS76997_11350 [Aspergillus niger]|nr:hypothetical protein CBS13152_11312 [Aspergillus niger]KAI2868353.1 hypothetical protein CBS11852_11364 [Aspergillus niger]KAI2946869.1 hypothetical protein CBS147323_11231 [Aspergillus niger]KAI3032914.1 hypothetical protein CBS76997_11350 [Aspergillus niger]
MNDSTPLAGHKVLSDNPRSADRPVCIKAEIITIPQDLFRNLSPFINHGSTKSSRAVGRSSGFHCKANRNHLTTPSTSSPSISAASFSNDRSGIGTKFFQFPDSSQKTQLIGAYFKNSGDGGPSNATSSAI